MKELNTIRPEYNCFISMIISVNTLCGFAPYCVHHFGESVTISPRPKNPSISQIHDTQTCQIFIRPISLHLLQIQRKIFQKCGIAFFMIQNHSPDFTLNLIRQIQFEVDVGDLANA